MQIRRIYSIEELRGQKGNKKLKPKQYQTKPIILLFKKLTCIELIKTINFL